MEHLGVKVVLSGKIMNKSREMYFGAAVGGMLSPGAFYEFIQLTRDLDGPGVLDSGSHEYKFSFKNVDLDVDSYNGISMDVEYQVWAEMKVQGQLMVYSVKT